jgi:hypothetical protein
MLSIRLLSATNAPVYRAGHETRHMKRDREATLMARFDDARSFLWKDGREQLVGLDWKNRLKDLEARCSGFCEMTKILGKPHVPDCDGWAGEPHHIIRRSVSRDDRLSNLAGLSHACHDSLDDRKVRSDRKEHREKTAI